MHRDLKPDNVFIAVILPSQHVAKLGDFGLLRDDDQSKTKGVGTPLYMSPEQHQEQRYGVFSDMWAAGLILYELFTGEHPFKSILDIVMKPPKPLPAHVPKEAAELLSNLLDKDPTKRMTSNELKSWLFKRQEEVKQPAAGASVLEIENAKLKAELKEAEATIKEALDEKSKLQTRILALET